MARRRTWTRPRLVVAVVASIALAGSGVVAGCGTSDGGSAGARADEPSGIVVTPPLEVGSLVLPEAGVGPLFRFRAPAGHLLLVYFGYTTCPDVCPTTMSVIRSARTSLGSSASRVDVAMVTVDPRRDTAQVLEGYVHGFIPDGHALRTTDDAALTDVAHAFGVHYEVEVAGDGSETVSHSGIVSVVDPSGRVRVQWPFGVSVPDVVHDLRLLLARRASAGKG